MRVRVRVRMRVRVRVRMRVRVRVRVRMRVRVRVWVRVRGKPLLQAGEHARPPGEDNRPEPGGGAIVAVRLRPG
jgi:hypothetical protein